MNPGNAGVYPLPPTSTRRLIRVSPNDLTTLDRIMVTSSSLFIVGSVAWIPMLLAGAVRRWRRIPVDQRQRRAAYALLSAAALVVLVAGPHRRPQFGQWLQARRWRLWRAWLRFVAVEVMADHPGQASADHGTKSMMDDHDSVMYAFCPHGIFPFAFALGALPELAQQAFGVFRPVVATAIQLFPVVREILNWVEPIDASRRSVDRVLAAAARDRSSCCRIGVIPGGIAEIFEGYPKAGAHVDEEIAIVRKGFLKLAAHHGVPVVPVYCFGANHMLRRWQLPLLEQLSLLLRVSICIFYGTFGLPVPFRQRLLYIMGRPIVPPSRVADGAIDDIVDTMHAQFCQELKRIFDQHKESYGWGHKALKLLTR